MTSTLGAMDCGVAEVGSGLKEKDGEKLGASVSSVLGDGATVATKFGVHIGIGVGLLVGENVVGFAEGLNVGFAEGICVGFLVRENVGLNVDGISEGIDGSWVGESVGSAVGPKVATLVGVSVIGYVGISEDKYVGISLGM